MYNYLVDGYYIHDYTVINVQFYFQINIRLPFTEHTFIYSFKKI